MAEIKSTLELVMERAARMGTASSEEIQEENDIRQGKQLAATYLNQAPDVQQSLPAILQEEDEKSRPALRKGMIASLLHNIFLPREEESKERIALALTGLVSLGGNNNQLIGLCRELETVTGQYTQHRTQLYDQLKEQMTMQIQQMIMQQTGRPPAEGMDIDPTMEPKFNEEWSRLEGELDGQYGQALTQYKAQLESLLENVL